MSGRRYTPAQAAALAAMAYPMKAAIPAAASEDGQGVELHYEEPDALKRMSRKERRVALTHARKALGMPK